MRYFLRRRVPGFTRVLLVESGSRHLSEYLLTSLRQHWNSDLIIDLVTCYAGLPAGFPAATRVFNISEYSGRSGRQRLYRELRASGYSVLGIICSGEPVMTKWKWALAARLPAKVFVLNENADYFWVDYSQWRLICRFALYRAGFGGAGLIRALARLALFPFTLLYLLLYAATVHLRRKAYR